MFSFVFVFVLESLNTTDDFTDFFEMCLKTVGLGQPSIHRGFLEHQLQTKEQTSGLCLVDTLINYCEVTCYGRRLLDFV